MRARQTLLASLTLAGLLMLMGCGDGRTRAFCNTICECQGDEFTVQECADQCTGFIEDADDAINNGLPIISDECFSCANYNSCQLFDVVCKDDCAALFSIVSVSDSSEPEPVDF